jgi:hypothetical protein
MLARPLLQCTEGLHQIAASTMAARAFGTGKVGVVRYSGPGAFSTGTVTDAAHGIYLQA